MDRITELPGRIAGLFEWLAGLGAAAGVPWEDLISGFSGLVFVGLAGGVAGFTRRRQDLFSGLSIGWGFALLLGGTGLLMLAAPLAPAGAQDWVRGGQVVTAPLALVLMGLFLLRIRHLEDSEDSEAGRASLHTDLQHTQQRLENLKAKAAELERQRREAVSETQRLASERNAAVREAHALKVRDEDTGLYTRGHLIERLRQEFERTHRRGGVPLPLFVGLQGLEALSAENRKTALKRAGRVVQEGLRLPDLACQFAERELLVIPCETDAKGAQALARRLHRRLKRGLARLEGAEGVSVACVFVLLDFEYGPPRFEDFLEACDQSVGQVRKQPANRLIRIPARFQSEA